MRAADIARRAFSQAALANPANLANNAPGAGRVAVANACEFCESGQDGPAIRNHSQPFANQENRANAGDSQHSQDSQLGESENINSSNWQRAGNVARDLIARLSQAWACPPGEYEELLALYQQGKLTLDYIERLIQDSPPGLARGAFPRTFRNEFPNA